MNDPHNPPPDELDALLAAHLERQAQSVDGAPLEARIQATLRDERPAPARPVREAPRLLRWVRWAGLLTTGAVIFVAGMYFNRPDQPLRASPQALLQEARKTLDMPVYRCYHVEVQVEPGITDESNPLAVQSRRTHLWTRGDRFWMESLNPAIPVLRWTWGRDEQGTIWMLFPRMEGVRITAAETPRWLKDYCDLCSMQPDRLLADVLRDFDLRREEVPEGSSVQIIHAHLKPGHWHPALRSAVLELDAETKVLRRVVLQRFQVGRTLTTSYTLVETRNKEEIHYPLDAADGRREFFSAEYKPEARMRMLGTIFGERGVNWLRPPPKLMKKP